MNQLDESKMILPMEILFTIFINVTPETLIILKRTSKDFKEIVSSEYFYKKYIQRNLRTQVKYIEEETIQYSVSSQYVFGKKHGIEQWNYLYEDTLNSKSIYKLLSWKWNLQNGEERTYLPNGNLISIIEWSQGNKNGEAIIFDPYNTSYISKRMIYFESKLKYEMHYTPSGNIALYIQWNPHDKHYYSGLNCHHGRYHFYLAMHAASFESVNEPLYDKINKYFEYCPYDVSYLYSPNDVSNTSYGE
jgi:hypothetical protein